MSLHVGDATRESEHYDEESYEKHTDVLHHGVNTEDDGAEVF